MEQVFTLLGVKDLDELLSYGDFILRGLFTLICMRVGFFLMTWMTTSAVPPSPPRDPNAVITGPIKEPLGLIEYTKVLASAAKGQLVVVDYWASWCGPCVKAGPFFAALAETHSDVLFVKVEDGESRDVMKASGIRGFPTFRFFVDGKCVQQVMGGDRKKITQLVETLQVAAKRGDAMEAVELPKPEADCVIM